MSVSTVVSGVADFVQAAVAYAASRTGKVAAFIAVAAPTLHVTLNNTEANALAEAFLVAVFVFEEGAKLIEKAKTTPVKK